MLTYSCVCVCVRSGGGGGGGGGYFSGPHCSVIQKVRSLTKCVFLYLFRMWLFADA